MNDQIIASPRASATGALAALVVLVPVPSIGVWFAMVHEPTRGTALGQGVYAASKVWILAVPLVWLFLADRGRVSLSPARQGGFVAGLATGLAIAAAILMGFVLFGRDLIDADQMRQAAARNGLGTLPAYVGAAVYLTLINSLLEEYVWRWFVYRQCEIVLGGKAAAVALSALLFTVHHVVALRAQTNWSVTLLGSAGIFVGACCWSALYARYRSIWPGYVSHVLADVAVVVVGWWVIFGG